MLQLLISAVVLTAISPPAKELVSVDRLPGDHFWHRRCAFHYAMADGSELVTSIKLRGVIKETEQAYAEYHPKFVKIQNGFTHWNPLIGGVSGGVQGVSSTWPYWKKLNFRTTP